MLLRTLAIPNVSTSRGDIKHTFPLRKSQSVYKIRPAPFYIPMQLRPYQQEAISALWRYWQANPQGSPLLVMPTGAGKSLLLASIIQQILAKNPNLKFLVVTHVKELIEQNALEFQKLTGILPGIYSAGLGVKKLSKITFAGIQSLYKKADNIDCDLLIVDECHLISSNDDSMYQKLIKSLKDKNPKLKVLGLTATPFRMDQGALVKEGGVFDGTAYDINIARLIELGYLCPVRSLSKEQVDLSQVKTSGHDYNQIDLQGVFGRKELIQEHVKKIIEIGKDKKSWLVFCSGIDHAKEVTEELKRNNITAEYITGDTPVFERDLIIKEFKNGNIKCLCNVGVLTTGFNAPSVDMLVLLRATKSAGLYIQMVGRGTRLSPGKSFCLVVDFGGNILRHGPIDAITYKAKKDREKVGLQVATSKKCERCGCVVAVRTLVCPHCEWMFPDRVQDLELVGSDAPILSKIEEYYVKDLRVKKHQKPGKPNSIMIEYFVDEFKRFYDFLCFDHGGFATKEAHKKWIKISNWQKGWMLPRSTDEALTMLNQLKEPKSIKVIKDGKYYKILDIQYKDLKIEQDYIDF